MSYDNVASELLPDIRITRGSEVAVIITTYNDSHFLVDSLSSVMAQTRVPHVVLVVDDGSIESPAPIVAEFPGVRLLRQDNAGLAAARNTGLGAVEADYILFLDADDTLAPDAVRHGLDCFQGNVDAGMVYGGYLMTGSAMVDERELQLFRIDSDPFGQLCGGNRIGMHGAVMYDRRRLAESGGFDETLRRCEDYDVYLRMASSHPVVSHSSHVANYRIHGDNMSVDPADMLDWARLVHDRYRPDRRQRTQYRAWKLGQARWKRHYAALAWSHGRQGNATGMKNDPRFKLMSRAPIETMAFPMIDWFRKRVSKRTKSQLRKMMWTDAPPAVGKVNFGDFGRITPISDDFGWDRGSPIDRYYVEGFIARNSTAIRGRVLEIGDDAYSRQFGNGVTHQDILNLNAGQPGTTIVGDISVAGTLPESSFDCIILAQTLHLIYDLASALQNLRSALKPGGVLLVTAPGLSPVDRNEWGNTWYWSLTDKSLGRLLADSFGDGHFEVASCGNIYAATCFLQGLAQEEVKREWLAHTDTAFPVIVTARAVRGADNDVAPNTSRGT